MAWFHPKNLLDNVFEGSLLLKGLSGLAEFICGLMLFFVHPAQIQHFISFLTQRELAHNSHEVITSLLLQATTHVAAGTSTFLIIYLWIHAGVKLVAVAGILLNQRWAYPFSLISLGLLALYQVYDIVFVKPSLGLIALTLFDVFVLWMIGREYKKVQANNSR